MRTWIQASQLRAEPRHQGQNGRAVPCRPFPSCRAAVIGQLLTLFRPSDCDVGNCGPDNPQTPREEVFFIIVLTHAREVHVVFHVSVNFIH